MPSKWKFGIFSCQRPSWWTLNGLYLDFAMSICLMNISIVGIKYRQVKFEFNEEKRHEKWVQERTEAYQRLFISLINQGQTMLLNILFASSLNFHVQHACMANIRGAVRCIFHSIWGGFSDGKVKIIVKDCAKNVNKRDSLKWFNFHSQKHWSKIYKAFVFGLRLSKANTVCIVCVWRNKSDG